MQLNLIESFLNESNVELLKGHASAIADVPILVNRIINDPSSTKEKKQMLLDALCEKGHNAITYLTYYSNKANDDFTEKTVQAIIRDHTSLIGAMDVSNFNDNQKKRILTEICKNEKDMKAYLMAELFGDKTIKNVLEVTLENNILISARYIYDNMKESKFCVSQQQWENIEQLAIMAKLAGI